MGIPKTIHYCWFGGNSLPKSAQKCIKSWKKHCPGWEIKLWNEENFDLECNAYIREMYRQKKWAFLTDYARLKIVYEQGGVYLDTDVELLKPLESLTEQGAFMGFECSHLVATGLGFGAEAGHPFLKENMAYYENLTDFSSLRACPHITTALLEVRGLVRDCAKTQHIAGLTVYASEVLCPKNERTGLMNKTANTVSIHHYDASWFEPSWTESKKRRYREEKLRYILKTPNRIAMKLLGEDVYLTIKKRLGRK